MPDSPEPREESPVDIESLEELFSFVPPPLRHDPDFDVPTPKWSPVTFYDKHLDDSLVLKQVKVLPGLISTLDEALDEYVSSFKSRGEPFYSPSMALRWHIYNKDVVATASDISQRYYKGGNPFVQAASVLAFHPDQPELRTVFSTSGSLLEEPPDFHSERYSLQHSYEDGPSFPVMLKALDDDRRALLLSMRKNLPHLAVYEAYALSGKTVLDDMSRLSGLATFPWKRGGGSLYRQSLSHRAAPPDISKYLWATKPADSPVQVIEPIRFRRSERLKGLAPTPSLTSKYPSQGTAVRAARKAATPGTIIRPKKFTSLKYQASAADFVQRAWAQAVNFDSTIILFDCGNYFRVGVRHRKTQTLYISNLVDVSSCSEPVYGKLMVAINLAIIRDAMDRTALLDPLLHQNKPSLHPRKRRRATDDTAPVRRSRRKLGEPNKEVEPEEILSELSSRNVTLLYFRNGKYNSPYPSFFRRAGSSIRKRSYRYDECLTFELGRKLGQGAVGEAYEASLEVDFGEGNVAHYPDKVIVKLALYEEQRKKLRHEYSIYHHLSEGPVRVGNIPRAFGFFEDVESEAGALILSHAGEALAYRSSPPGTGVRVSAKERAIYIEILTSIHAAGVAHGDIRSWNLLEDDKGGYFIADFDRAKLHGSRVQMAAEQDRLGLLLDGENIDDDSVTSYPASS
ncbi:hypothetical protein ARMSODRAFT_1087334 [Armillaria solidipes]|uniref:Protein kinase domain-containing protein n=1 Tax=Armillaria solidipes TaxID=1076256 RepID=A0A2H3BRL9_9AGAR|nr:hypothetical protein ARMSODRAFT_1087334 [Armillaria solidipes]